MTKLILVANWKNHPSSPAEAGILLRGLAKKTLLFKKFSTFIAPPYSYFSMVGEKAHKYADLATQDLSLVSKGTCTGEITQEILKSFGVRLAIIGHSERRALGESSESVSKKVALALKSGITPLVCVGENERDQDGEHFDLLREQVKTSLQGITKQQVGKVILAYEPVWAVGAQAKGSIEPAELSQAVIFIRKVLSDLYSRKVAESVVVLYGGSVDPTNARALVKESGVSGLLVGRASLDGQKFASIAESLLQK